MLANERINQLQFISTGFCVVMGTILRSVLINSVAVNDAWLIGFFGLIAFLPGIWMYVTLAKRYPGKSLFEISEAVFGQVIGRVFSSLYLFFFLFVAIGNIKGVGNFVTGFLLVDTPNVAIMGLMMFVCGYCLRKGLEPLARIAPAFAVMAVVVLVGNTLFSLGRFNPQFFLPILSRPLLDYVQSTHAAVSIPYGESIVLMMMLPMLGNTGQFNVKKSYLAIAVFTSLIMLLVHGREVGSLGPLLAHTTYPSFEVIRMSDANSTVARTESLYAMLLISLAFFKICVMAYAAASGLAQITRMSSYRPLVPAVCAFLCICALIFQQSPMNSVEWSVNVTPFISSTFEYALPALTLLVSFVKGKLQSGKAASA